MQGTRRDIDNSEWQTGEVWDYGKIISDDGQWHWYGCVPEPTLKKKFLMAGLAEHEVTEHEDGTITVSPSILVGHTDGAEGWHGYLEHGIWREV